MTEQTQCIFERNRIGFAKQRIGELRNRVAKALRTRHMAPLARQEHAPAQGRRDVGGNRNAAVAPLSQECQCGRIVTRKKPEFRPDTRPKPRRPRNVARCILQTEELRPSARRTTVSSASLHAVRDGTS